MDDNIFTKTNNIKSENQNLNTNHKSDISENLTKNLDEIKLNVNKKTSSVNDVFENINENKSLHGDSSNGLNNKDNNKTNIKSDDKGKINNKSNGKTSNIIKSASTIFTLPVIILMVLVVILIVVIIYIIRKKMNKNDDLISDYEEQKEKILQENSELRKEINLSKQKLKMLSETNQELQNKLDDQNHFKTENYKPKSFKEHKTEKWNISNSYINDKKTSNLSQELNIQEESTMKLDPSESMITKKKEVTSNSSNESKNKNNSNISENVIKNDSEDDSNSEQEEYIEELLN